MKRRCNLSLTDELHETLDQLSELTGTPKATILAQVIEQLNPQFKHLLDALQVVRRHPDKAAEVGNDYLQKAINDVRSLVDDLEQ